MRNIHPPDLVSLIQRRTEAPSLRRGLCTRTEPPELLRTGDVWPLPLNPRAGTARKTRDMWVASRAKGSKCIVIPAALSRSGHCKERGEKVPSQTHGFDDVLLRL